MSSSSLPSPSPHLSSLRVCFSGYTEMDVTVGTGVCPSPTEVKALASSHGAQTESVITRRTDLLIVWRGLTAKRLKADEFHVPVATPEVFCAEVAKRSSSTALTDTAHWLSALSPPRLLYGYEFSDTRVPVEESKALKTVVERHGGTWTSSLTSRCDALFVSAAYAAQLKELNAFFQRRQRQKAAMEEKSKRGAKHRVRGETAVGEREEEEEQEEERRLEGLSNKVCAAWLLDIPVLSYERFLLEAQLPPSPPADAPVGAAERVSFLPTRKDFDTIVDVARIEASHRIMSRLVVRHRQLSGRLAVKGRDEWSSRPMETFDAEGHGGSSASSSHSGARRSTSSGSCSSLSENTVLGEASSSSSSSCQGAYAFGDGDDHCGVACEEEADGFTESIAAAPAPRPCPPAREEQTLTSQFADPLTLPEEAAGPAVVGADSERVHPTPVAAPTARDIVRAYYMKQRETAGEERAEGAPHFTKARMASQVLPQACTGVGHTAGAAVSLPAHRATRPGPSTPGPVDFLLPFYLHHPPLLTVCLLGCIGREERDAGRMALACRFLMTPIPTAETDVVVLGRLAVRRKKWKAGRPAPAPPSCAHDDRDNSHRVEEKTRRSPVPPLREAAAAAHRQHMEELRARRERKRRQEQGREKSLGDGPCDGYYHYYEVSYELAEQLKTQCGLPTHRLAPLAWLRACYHRVQEKLAAEVAGGRGHTAAHAEQGTRPPLTPGCDSSGRPTFGFAETFREGKTGNEEAAYVEETPNPPFTDAFPCDVRGGSPSAVHADCLAEGDTANLNGSTAEEAEEEEEEEEEAWRGVFDPRPALAEEEILNPHAPAFRVHVARPPGCSPFAPADGVAADADSPVLASGQEETARVGEVEREPQRRLKSREQGRPERRKEEAQQHAAAAAGVVTGRSSSSLVLPLLVGSVKGVRGVAEEALDRGDGGGNEETHGKSSSSGGDGGGDGHPSRHEEAAAAGERRQAAELLRAFHDLILCDPRALASSAALPPSESPSARTAVRCDVFQRLVFCLTEGEYSRPFAAAVRALIKLGGGASLKRTREEWRAALRPSAAQASEAPDLGGDARKEGGEAEEQKRASLEAVRRSSVFGKRKRDALGSVLAHIRLNAVEAPTAAVHGEPPRGKSAFAAAANSSSPRDAAVEPRADEERESTVCAPTAAPDGCGAGGDALTMRRVKAAAAAALRGGVVAVSLLPHAHERGEEMAAGRARRHHHHHHQHHHSGGNSRGSMDNDKPPLRHLPSVTSDYVLSCLAVERVLDPTKCFCFHTPTPSRAEMDALLLLLDDRDAAPRLSAWQSERRYEKRKSVGVCVSFLWVLPHPPSGDGVRPPTGPVASLIRILFSALARVVSGLGGTVCEEYDVDAVTHSVLIDVAAMVSSSLEDCFLLPGLRTKDALEGGAQGQAEEAVLLWPLPSARAAAADARAGLSCIASDRWLRDCLERRRFLDEASREEYQQHAVARVAALLEQAKASEGRWERVVRQPSEEEEEEAPIGGATPPQADRRRTMDGPERSSTPIRNGRQTPLRVHEAFNFHTPGSTPIASRAGPAYERDDEVPKGRGGVGGQWARQPSPTSGSGAPVDPALASPQPLPMTFPQPSQQQQQQQQRKQKPIRSVRQASRSQSALAVSPRHPRHPDDPLADGSTSAGGSGIKRGSSLASSSLLFVDSAMEMRRSALYSPPGPHRGSSASRHSRSQARALPTASRPSGEGGVYQRPSLTSMVKLIVDEEQRQQQQLGEEEEGRLPRVVLSSAESSLSQAPPHALPSQTSRGSKRQRDEVKKHDGEGALETAEEGVTTRRRLSSPSMLPPRDARNGGEGVAGGTSLPDPASTTAAASEPLSIVNAEEEEATQDVAEEGGNAGSCRLAYVATSPPPRRDDAFGVDEAANTDEEQSQRGEEARNDREAAEKKKTHEPQAAGRLAVYLLGDLPGRDSYLKQYSAAVKKLLPTLPATGNPGGAAPPLVKRSHRSSAPGRAEAETEADPAAVQGPFVFVNRIEKADCLVSHELSQRETVLAAVAAGLWVVKPAFLSKVIANLTRARRCEEYLGKTAPALVRLLELHEWSAQTLPHPAPHSPSPPPPPLPQQQQQQQQQQHQPSSSSSSSSLLGAAAYRISLAEQCGAQRRRRQEAMRRSLTSGDGAPGNEGEGRYGVFAGHTFVLFFSPDDMAVTDGHHHLDDGDGVVRGSGGGRAANPPKPLPVPGALAGEGGGDAAGGATVSARDDGGRAAKGPFCRRRRRKEEALRVILHAGGADIAFLGPLEIPPPDRKGDAVISDDAWLEQVTSAVVRALLRPLCRRRAEGGPAQRPVLRETTLSVLFDHHLLTALRVRRAAGAGGEEGSVDVVPSTWLHHLLSGGVPTAGHHLPGNAGGPSRLTELLECVRLARRHVVQQYTTDLEAFVAAHPAEGAHSRPLKFAAAPATTPKLPFVEYPANRHPSPGYDNGKKAKRGEGEKTRAESPSSSSSSSSSAAAAAALQPSTRAREVFEALLRECEAGGAGPRSGTGSVYYVAPREIAFKDMACVALDIAAVGEVTERPPWHLGSIAL